MSHRVFCGFPFCAGAAQHPCREGIGIQGTASSGWMAAGTNASFAFLLQGTENADVSSFAAEEPLNGKGTVCNRAEPSVSCFLLGWHLICSRDGALVTQSIDAVRGKPALPIHAAFGSCPTRICLRVASCLFFLLCAFNLLDALLACRSSKPSIFGILGSLFKGKLKANKKASVLHAFLSVCGVFTAGFSLRGSKRLSY